MVRSTVLSNLTLNTEHEPSQKRMRDISNITPTSTPKKQKRSFNTPTKQTESSSITPASTPTKSLGTPSTEKGVKQLFQTTNKTPNSLYTKAKALFQRGSDTDSTLISRESEAILLNQFLLENITNQTSSSLYISGPPGTGKTAQINASFRNLTREYGTSKDAQYDSIFGGASIKSDSVIRVGQTSAKLIKINCMTLNTPEHIFHEIFSRISNKLSISYNRKNTSEDLKTLLEDGLDVTSVVVVLDEMDCLITRNQQVLFDLFHAASSKWTSKCKLILVGISNALDLTDKFLPRLKRNGLNPQAIQFLPYTYDQIRLVMIGKLRSLIGGEDKENSTEEIPLFHPGAIQFCCKKSASVTGDLRKAFDLAYKSLEVVEELNKSKGLDFASLAWSEYPKVLVPHVAKVCAKSFGHNKLGNLNLLQKAVLCSLFRCVGQELNVNELYDFYVKLSVVDQLLGVLKKGEFLEIISALESASVVSLGNKKLAKNKGPVDLGNKTIKPNVPYDDLVKSIGDIGVLKKILHSGDIA